MSASGISTVDGRGRRRCLRTRSADAVDGPGTCSQIPAFGGALRESRIQSPADRHRSVHFPQGATGLESGRHRPLKKMTSAACGVAGRLDCERAPRGLPGKAFFGTPAIPNGLLDEESHATHAPSERALFESGVNRQRRVTATASTSRPRKT